MTIPLVSVLMVARNAAAFIDAAILSVREQSLSDLEVVVLDDGSIDDTAAIARDHAAQDARVRLVEGSGRGLSAVRNASLDAARGRFAAILDSDDVLHPRHLEWLVAGRAGAQICAANMIEFATGSLTPRLFAQGGPWSQPRMIGAGEFVAHGMIGGGKVSLGYLKPLFDINFLNTHGLRYDERLRIGEDFDLVLRALLVGAEYRFLPQATYYYRKHAASTSHRLSRDDLEGLLNATGTYHAVGEDARWLHARRENLEGALLHLDAVAAIKAGRPLRALALAAAHADARRLTVATLGEALVKRAGRLRSKSEVSASPPTGAEPVIDRLRAMTEALRPVVSLT
jgi:succinoglycan biosynthesis protein ExoO